MTNNTADAHDGFVFRPQNDEKTDKIGLTFGAPNGDDIKTVAETVKNLREGCEAYTQLSLDGENSASLFLVGKDGNGKIKKTVFSYGDTVYVLEKKAAKIYVNAAVTPLGEIVGNAPCVMEYVGDVPNENEKVSTFAGTDIIKSFLLTTNFVLSRSDEIRYVHRVRASAVGFAKVFGICDGNGSALSVASIVAENEKYALIGDVFTHPNSRNRGFAAAACLACCRCAMQKGKTPWLICSPETSAYYSRLSFREIE